MMVGKIVGAVFGISTYIGLGYFYYRSFKQSDSDKENNE